MRMSMTYGPTTRFLNRTYFVLKYLSIRIIN